MEFTPKRHNTPVATLIKLYENKKSGCVVEARKELQWRFDNLDWKDQKKILKAHLNSGKTDREWAARKLVSCWDDCFASIVKNLWEETQDPYLAWPIVRYFPINYLKENIDKLGDDRNYYFLCLRLAEEKDFEIDESKLKETNLLSVYRNSSRVLSKEKAIDILYSITYKLCTDKYSYQMNNMWPEDEERGYCVSIIKNGVMMDAIDCLEYFEMYDVLDDFKKWHETACEHLLKSDEFARLYASRIVQDGYNHRRLLMTKKNYYEHLESKYKPTNEKPVFETGYYRVMDNANSEHFLNPLTNIEVDEAELDYYDHIVRKKAMEKLKGEGR